MKKILVIISLYLIVLPVFSQQYANRIVLLEDRLFDTLVRVNNIDQHNFNYVVIPQKDFELIAETTLDCYSILNDNCFWIEESAFFVQNFVLPNITDSVIHEKIVKDYPNVFISTFSDLSKLYSGEYIKVNNLQYRKMIHFNYLVLLVPVLVYKRFLDQCDFEPPISYSDLMYLTTAKGIYIKMLIPISE